MSDAFNTASHLGWRSKRGFGGLCQGICHLLQHTGDMLGMRAMFVDTYAAGCTLPLHSSHCTALWDPSHQVHVHGPISISMSMNMSIHMLMPMSTCNMLHDMPHALLQLAMLGPPGACSCNLSPLAPILGRQGACSRNLPCNYGRHGRETRLALSRDLPC